MFTHAIHICSCQCAQSLHVYSRVLFLFWFGTFDVRVAWEPKVIEAHANKKNANTQVCIGALREHICA